MLTSGRMSDATLAVTGANGFVGRVLIRRASAEGWRVTGLVRSHSGAGLVARDGGRPHAVGELETERLVEGLRGARAVVHLAQIGSERDGASYEHVNVQGTRRVVEAALASGVERLVYLSGLGVAHYGMTPPCTNPYFLSKLSAELELFRSKLEAAVFRPSYILGPESEFLSDLLQQMQHGELEIVGAGEYRLQPIAVDDAAAAILAAVTRTGPWPAVFDLVGPEPLALRLLVDRLARAAAAAAPTAHGFSVRTIPLAEARRAAASGGYRGLGPDQLDCLVCDETGDPRPLEALLGRFLTPLDELLANAVRRSAQPRA